MNSPSNPHLGNLSHPSYSESYPIFWMVRNNFEDSYAHEIKPINQTSGVSQPLTTASGGTCALAISRSLRLPSFCLGAQGQTQRRDQPLVMTNITMENHHVYWVSTISMAVFYSSVKLPEGQTIFFFLDVVRIHLTCFHAHKFVQRRSAFGTQQRESSIPNNMLLRYPKV